MDNNSRKTNRKRLEIVRDVLLAAEESSKKTHIMYGANLSYKLVTRYLASMTKAGLLKTSNNSNYQITDEGRNFLGLYEKYQIKRRKIRESLNSLENGKEQLEKMLLG